MIRPVATMLGNVKNREPVLFHSHPGQRTEQGSEGWVITRGGCFLGLIQYIPATVINPSTAAVPDINPLKTANIPDAAPVIN